MEESAEAAEIRYRWIRYKLGTLEMTGMGLWSLPGLIYFSSVAFHIDDWLTDQFATLQTPVFVVRIALLALMFSGFFLVIAGSLFWQANALRLRKDGLVIERGRRRQRWSWKELSQFRVLRLKKRAVPSLGSKLLIFDSSDSDFQSRVLQWHFGVSSARPAVVIEDIYDAPIDEIAARLNDYRAGALPSTRGSS